MARIRTIKPDFFRSEDTAGLSPHSRLLFIGLWTMADREGRLLDRPRKIGIELFPWEPDIDVSMLLDELAARRLIVRYTVDLHICIAILSFGKHQRPHPQEPCSDIPAPPTISSPGDVGANRDLQLSITAHNDGLSSEGREGKGKEGVGEKRADSFTPAEAPSEPPVLTFPASGKAGTWGMAQHWLDEAVTAFPGVDVMAEMRLALAKINNGACRKPTARGMSRFLMGWLGRANDRGPPGQRSGPYRRPNGQEVFEANRAWAEGRR